MNNWRLTTEYRYMNTFNLSELGSPNILVLGDVILDKYVWGKVERISPEAPIQILNTQREEIRLGGAANVAHNLVTLGAKASLVSIIGNDNTGRELRRRAQSFGINTAGLIASAYWRTSLKTRMIAQNQQVLRVDNEKPSTPTPETTAKLLNYIKRNINRFDLVIISDYNKGTLTPAMLKSVITLCRSKGKQVIIDPKGRDYSKYRGATALTPNRSEAELATGIHIPDDRTRKQAAQKLLRTCALDFVIITLGERGLYLLDKKGNEAYDPARHMDVYDVTGAGDTALATLGIAFASRRKPCGWNYQQSLHLANLAAGVVVSKVGTATTTREEILEHSNQLHDTGYTIRDTRKVVSAKELLGRLVQLSISRESKFTLSISEGHHHSDKKVVFTNGCFDLLHPGHIATLEFAKSQGDILVVGLNSDKSVKKIKGPARPILNQSDRARVLSALSMVDYIVLFDEPTPLNLVKQIRPDVLVKGMDWQGKGVVGHDIIKKSGGKVVLAPIVKGVSTTTIINKIVTGTQRGKK